MSAAKETHQGDFKFYLQRELVKRCQKNPKYSLRAFARSLGIGASALSDMLNGKRTVTTRTVERLGLALGLSLKEIEAYKRTCSKLGTFSISPSPLKFQQLTLDMFAMISEWHHYAILELIKVENFEASPQWVAKALGITKAEANFAIERLLRLGLLVEKNGQWVDASEGFTTNISPGLTSAAARSLQKQILEKSICALEEVPLEMRNHTSMTMAIDPKDLPEAMEKIKNFRRNLCHYLENTKQPKEVYHLSISLFPATSVQKLKETK